MLVCSLRKWFSLSMARKMDYDIGREKRFFRALYLACSFLFLLANATSHSVCADDVLLVSNVNKRVGGQQAFLRDGWFYDGSTTYIQAHFQSIGGCCARRLLSLQPDFMAQKYDQLVERLCGSGLSQIPL